MKFKIMQDKTVLSNSRLTFIEFAGRNKGNEKLGLFQCSCGNQKIILLGNVRSGKSSSCGCLRKETAALTGSVKKHGLSKTPLYDKWHLMMRRCYEVVNKDYHYYGGRGIKVCEEWHDVVKFNEWALTNGWKKGLQIDRFPDMNGDYTPSNCRFVTSKENNNNRRDNHRITAFGRTQTLQQWADEIGVHRDKITYQIFSTDLKPEEVLSYELQKKRRPSM